MKPRLEFKLANHRSSFIVVADPKTPATPRVRPAVIAVLPTVPTRNLPNDLACAVSMRCHANAAVIGTSAGREATFKRLLKWIKNR